MLLVVIALLAATHADLTEPTMTLSQTLEGSRAPEQVTSNLALVDVRFVDREGEIQTGYLVVQQGLESEVQEIFQEIAESGYRITSVKPIDEFDWSDDASTQADNTSAFNYRKVEGSRILSAHAYGRAIDINPWANPYFKVADRLGQSYNPHSSEALTPNSPVVRAFKSRGWRWGGDWKHKDYQHFEKR